MDIHAEILEDFRKALADFHAALMSNDTQLKTEAQIFSFIRANEVFGALIRNIYDENTDDELHDPEQMIIALCALELISEEQVKRLIEQSDCADYLSLERNWFDVAEDAEYFDEEVASLPTYYEDMTILCTNLQQVATLVAHQEHHEGH